MNASYAFHAPPGARTFTRSPGKARVTWIAWWACAREGSPPRPIHRLPPRQMRMRPVAGAAWLRGAVIRSPRRARHGLRVRGARERVADRGLLFGADGIRLRGHE